MPIGGIWASQNEAIRGNSENLRWPKPCQFALLVPAFLCSFVSLEIVFKGKRLAGSALWFAKSSLFFE